MLQLLLRWMPPHRLQLMQLQLLRVQLLKLLLCQLDLPSWMS